MATAPFQSTEQGCSFFTKTPERIFTPEDFQGDERLMIETAEQFSRKEILPIQDQLDAKLDGLLMGVLRKAGVLGFCGSDSPDE